MIICKHCIKLCKMGTINKCDKYNPIANRPAQLPELIRKALNEGNYKEVEKLQQEQFRFNHG